MNNAELLFSNGILYRNGEEGELLSTKEYSEKFGVPENTIRVWVRRGKLDPVKIGRDNYFFVKKEA